MPYAEIVVNSPTIRSTAGYHYHVPLSFQVDIGHLVLVPFGPRQMQGVVVKLLEHSDVDDIKDIIDVIDPQPVLSPVQIQLAQWIADYYHCPLADAVRLMLPSGIQQRCIATIEARLDVHTPADLTERQISLLSFLKQRGRMRVDRARAALSIPSFSATVSQLVRRGMIIRGWELEKPRIQPRIEKRVRIRRGLANAEAVLSEVQRAPQQRTVLEYLLDDARREDEHGCKDDGGVPVEKIRDDIGCTPQVLKALLDKGLVEIEEREVWRDPLANQAFSAPSHIALTQDQQEVWAAIENDLRQPSHRTYLLHGVTGSGKTEVYLRALEETLRSGRQGIILVPEIALTPQTVHRFASRFPGRVAVWHSRLSAGERYDEWRRIRDGALDIVVGSRSAIFAPLRNLGIIIIDEEHEWSYKNEKMPRYHARDAAIKLAELTGAKVIMGSATPDVVTYHRATTEKYRLLELRERVEAPNTAFPHLDPLPKGERIGELSTHPGSGQGRPPLRPDERGICASPEQPGREEIAASAEPLEGRQAEVTMALLPPVHIVDLRQELRAGNRSIFSRALSEAITLALAMREQVILFLNRRGTATFIMCRDCGYVLTCRRCNVPMVYHSAEDDLVCHQCNYRTFMPSGCPKCWGSRIKFFGVGTQKVEEETRKLFPEARILRWDSDAVSGRMAHERILQRFRNHEADILIGTQMIAKGLDLPLVTLVGVISADTVLHLPDFRAGERTFQLLTQVAGRAGRGTLGGRVIVQTYSPEHYAIQAASRHDYYRFYQQEIEFRREHGYPPFGRLIKLVYHHSNDGRCQQEARRMADLLRGNIDRLGLPGTEVIGPAPAYLHRIRGRYRWQIIVRGGQPSELLKGTPISPGWTVDVDPLTTL